MHLQKTHLYIRTLGQMYAFDEPHLAALAGHDNRSGTGAVSEEANALHQCAIGHAGGGKDQIIARRQVLAV